MAPRKFQIRITVYDARDVARFVDLMRGTNGNALIRLYGDAPVNEHALWSFHAPRQYGGSDWIANASLREVHPVGSEMGDGKMKTVVRRGEGKINAVVSIEAAGPEPLAHVGGPLGSFANGGNVPSGSPWAPAAELQSTGCDRCDAGDQPNNMGWHGGGENATPCVRNCQCGAAANVIIHASAHPDSHDFVPATPIPPSRSGARWLADHMRPVGEINPVAGEQEPSAGWPNDDQISQLRGELARKDREIEELKAKCHPLRCGHCSCFIESHGLEIDKCQRAACFPNYGPSMRAEIERLMAQVTELQQANTREVEARRAVTRNLQTLGGKYDELADAWRIEKARADAAEKALRDHHCKPPLGNPTREEAMHEMERLARINHDQERRLVTIKLATNGWTRD